MRHLTERLDAELSGEQANNSLVGLDGVNYVEQHLKSL